DQSPELTRPAAEPAAEAQYLDPPALAGDRWTERDGGHGRLLARIPDAGRPLLRADRRFGRAEPSARVPLPGRTSAEPAGGDGHPHIRQSSTWRLDRKSTRLNSSHVKISYAVFCLKKKNTTN